MGQQQPHFNPKNEYPQLSSNINSAIINNNNLEQVKMSNTNITNKMNYN